MRALTPQPAESMEPPWDHTGSPGDVEAGQEGGAESCLNREEIHGAGLAAQHISGAGMRQAHSEDTVPRAWAGEWAKPDGS